MLRLTVIGMIGQVVIGGYPVQDKVPPTNAGWSTKVLHTIPDVPQKDRQGLPDFTQGFNNCNDKQVWGLSYDDGPNPATTPGLMKELDKRGNIKATFFVVGSRVIEHSQVLKDEFNAGHQIGLHTWSHPALTTLSNDQIVSELVWNALAVRSVIGVTPKYFRPPYGDIDVRVKAILDALGLTTVIWAVDSLDSAGSTQVAQVIGDYASQHPNSGPISLEHDLFPTEADQAPGALDNIIAAGFKPKPIIECLNHVAPAYDEKFWDIVGINPDDLSPLSSSSHSIASSIVSLASPSASIASTSLASAPTPTANHSVPTASNSTNITAGNSTAGKDASNAFGFSPRLFVSSLFVSLFL